ncbi:NfeD family protein [Cronobacter dublinensis subsp. dublinensis]|nr:NfeD family protein [Cronobacter dublinensis subsp. dublinensis]EGT5729936.1 NfeD family protein [Cronobacter dublinensis subsp. dublinensis]
MDIFVSWWGWIIVGAIFLLIELITTTFFGLWMAIAALVPATVSFFRPDLPLGWLIGIWMISMLVCAYLWVRISKRKNPAAVTEDGILGQVGILTRGSSSENPGVIILQKPVEGLTEWRCFSDDEIHPNSRVVVSEKIGHGVVRVRVQ